MILNTAHHFSINLNNDTSASDSISGAIVDFPTKKAIYHTFLSKNIQEDIGIKMESRKYSQDFHNKRESADSRNIQLP